MGRGGDAKLQAAPAGSSSNSPTKFTWQQVQKHNTPDDAWGVYRNKVYDISNWHEHPGGAVIFTHAGQDFEDIFSAFHAPGSAAVMQKFYIGDLIVESNPNKDAHQLAFEKGYRDLRSKLVVMGMFKTQPGFYVYKVVSTFMLWATAVAMVYFSDVNSTAVHVASALLMGLFFQQSGWLAHDFLHHQVFDKRKYGDLMGILIGNVWQGFSVQWWKNKHNGHHAVPNLHSTSALSQDGDPDIDTMPLLAWSLHQAQQYRELNQGKDSPAVQFLMRYQAYFYFPILLLARLSWLNESFKVTFGLGAASENCALELKVKGLQYPILEKLGTTLHYTWMLAVSTGFGRFGPLYAFAYFMIATASCGWFLATVFGLGHNGMATYSALDRPDFWKLQVTTTRNITGGHGFPQAFVDWFCGGLQYQVDHHLFPTLPRHNLKKAHVLISSFCKEWNVNYHETDLVDGNVEVLKHLSDVSNEFLIDFVRYGPTM